MNHSWRDHAKCIGQPNSVFFPENLHENRFDRALQICSGCSVREQCLQIVINLEDVDDKWGVFGGTTPRQRRTMRAQRMKGKAI